MISLATRSGAVRLAVCHWPSRVTVRASGNDASERFCRKGGMISRLGPCQQERRHRHVSIPVLCDSRRPRDTFSLIVHYVSRRHGPLLRRPSISLFLVSVDMPPGGSMVPTSRNSPSRSGRLVTSTTFPSSSGPRRCALLASLRHATGARSPARSHRPPASVSCFRTTLRVVDSLRRS